MRRASFLRSTSHPPETWHLPRNSRVAFFGSTSAAKPFTSPSAGLLPVATAKAERVSIAIMIKMRIAIDSRAKLLHKQYNVHCMDLVPAGARGPPRPRAPAETGARLFGLPAKPVRRMRSAFAG
jgi:hypothetical protein